MNIDDLKKLAPADAIKKAAEYAGVPPSVLDGIWRVESGRGTNKGPSRAGAVGDFQIMPATQQLLEKKLGRKFDASNFYDSLVMSAEHIKDDLAREGNIADALRAYNAGPDRKRWNNPETQAYASKVLATDVPEYTPGLQADDGKMPAKLERKGDGSGMPKTAAAATAIGFLRPVSGPGQAPGEFEAQAVKDQATAQAAEKERQETGFLDTSREIFQSSGLSAAIMTLLTRESNPPTPGFKVPEEKLVGLTVDQAAHVLSATNEKDMERYLFEVDAEKESMRRAGLNGPWFALAAGVFAGLPEAVVTGAGVARTMSLAGYGSRMAAAAGNTQRAVALSAVENVGGNILTTALEDALTHRVSVMDYAFAAGAGTLAFGLDAPFKLRDAATALEVRTRAAAIERQVAMARQAEANLGPAATPEQLRAEISRLESEEIAGQINTSTAPVDSSRRLLSEDVNAALSGEIEVVSRKSAVDGISDDTAPEMLPGGYGVLDLDRERLIRWDGEQVRVDDKLKYLGFDPDEVRAGVPGIRTTVDIPKEFVDTAGWLQRTFGKDMQILLTRTDSKDVGIYGSATPLGKGTVLVKLDVNQPRAMQTLLHEIGHAVMMTQWGKVADRMGARLESFLKEFRELYVAGDPKKAALMRGAVSSPYTPQVVWNPAADKAGTTMFDIMRGAFDQLGNKVTPTLRRVEKSARTYTPNADEMLAEGFAKYIEASVSGNNKKWAPVAMPAPLVDFVNRMFKMVKSIYDYAMKNDLIAPDTRLVEIFEAIRKVNRAEETKQARVAAGLAPDRDIEVVTREAQATGFDESRYGINLMPEATPMQRAEKKAMIELYERASNADAPWNNIDPKFVSSLTDNNLVQLGSTGLLLLKSQNPVARMIAHELLESTTGATGRHSTAALAKHLVERKLMGNIVNELQDNFGQWATAAGYSLHERWLKPEAWDRFNVAVAEHIESIRTGRQPSDNVHIQNAALRMQGVWERMRHAQINAKTLGYAALPETSAGYMPHRMSPAKLRNLTQPQEQAIHSALVDQFVTVEGWDLSFSANLASKYLDAIRTRANGGYNAPLGAQDTGAAELIRRALEDMGMSEDEVAAQMNRYTKGGASHTKKRLNLDLLKEYNDGAGGTFRLLDLYETDQLGLVRQQVGRVSGEVALARHGIMGRPGLKVLRKALDFGDTNGKVQPKEVGAFDQVAAEFLGDPFGQANKAMDRLQQLNSLARLGGMGITQFAEYINMAMHVGAWRTLSSIGDAMRLRKEVKALAKGQAVDNPILNSLEFMGGAEFGTDAYKMVFPFDRPDLQYQINTGDTITVFDRLLRGGSHLQGKLSFWRTIHSVQQRGAAEQIVHKALRYIRDGAESKALDDMGINEALRNRIQMQLDTAATWEGGRLASFDVTKLDPADGRAFIEAVHRGSAQMIQGTFIGETGKWAHDGWLRLLSQFRTFSITAVEKQWGRQRASRGIYTALAMTLGAMSIAIPIHLARVYAMSAGRPDREEYIKKQTEWDVLGRASMNYIATSGLAGDFIDALSAVSGVGAPQGGRNSGGQEFVGSVVLPAAGLVDDVWKGVQNTRDGTDPHQLLKAMPFSNLPMFKVLINHMAD